MWLLTHTALSLVTPRTDLTAPGRLVTVVTTAALPWRTGTSVNPTLRAGTLAHKGIQTTLLLPWLDPAAQPYVFPEGITFRTPDEQAKYVRSWLADCAGIDAQGLQIRWYSATYEPFHASIVQAGDIDLTQCVPEAERDVVILEEPEHLNWYHHGRRWSDEYAHVIGVGHTNYPHYAQYEERPGTSQGDIPPERRAQMITAFNSLVCAAYVDVVLQLSSTLPKVPGHCRVCNVHGVRREFLQIGAAAATAGGGGAASGGNRGGGAYFLGKASWTKGYRDLFDQLRAAAVAGRPFAGTINTYGSGRDFDAIRAEAEDPVLGVAVHAGVDHADESLHRYWVFINPSTSEVLCTATAEALAMGKRVVLPRHPSNAFFASFSNAILYDTPDELLPALERALATPPLPLSADEAHALSWDAATDRLFAAASMEASLDRPTARPLHRLAYAAHFLLGVQPLFDAFREGSGVSPVVPWLERVALMRQQASAAALRVALPAGLVAAATGVAAVTGSTLPT